MMETLAPVSLYRIGYCIKTGLSKMQSCHLYLV